MMTQYKKILWYDKNKGLQGSVLSKARKFVKLGCVSCEIGNFHWIISPISGYSKTKYDVTSMKGHMSCNCQYNKLNDRVCSHILAVELFEEIKNGSI